MVKSFDFDTLIVAINRQNLEEVKEICENNPKILDQINVDEWGPIHFCAAYGNGEILDYLISKGANKEQLTRENWTPFLLALRQNNKDTLRRLFRAGVNYLSKTTNGDDAITILCKKNSELNRLVFYCIDPNLRVEPKGDHLFLKGDLTEVRIC